MDKNLKWLLGWFSSQCNREWEKSKAISISTLDNPGWSVWIRIEGSNLYNEPFPKIKIERTETDWLVCFLEDGFFKGAGGPFNLGEIIQLFRNWSRENKEKGSPKLNISEEFPTDPNADNFKWLLQWFYSQCDGDWEHSHTIIIRNYEGCKWSFKVSIEETELFDQFFETVDIKRTEDDWIHCSIEKAPLGTVFQGYGGTFNLPELLKIFRSWAEGVTS